jgi:uncharacterized protein YbaA (DUF1428 family)
MSYVDGFLICVPKNKLKEYTKMAKEGKATWMKFGAVDYKECVGDDMTPENTGATFPKIAKAKDDELVFFSYIVFKNRKHRDSVNKKVHEYFGKKYAGSNVEMPFDMKRFSYGGFKAIVEA